MTKIITDLEPILEYHQCEVLYTGIENTLKDFNLFECTCKDFYFNELLIFQVINNDLHLVFNCNAESLKIELSIKAEEESFQSKMSYLLNIVNNDYIDRNSIFFSNINGFPFNFGFLYKGKGQKEYLLLLKNDSKDSRVLFHSINSKKLNELELLLKGKIKQYL